MDALKAGAHKAMETNEGKKVESKLATASDPSKKPSERADAAHDAGVAAQKQAEHSCKADCASSNSKSCC